MLERLSGAVEQIGPIIALVLLVPSAIVLAGLGAYAGYWLATGEPVMTFEAVRILLLAACGFAVIGPMLMPSMEPTAIVRLLLLPIPRGTLYAAQAGGALSEPWILVALPVVLALPLGLAAGGAVLAAVISLAAGALLILCLIGLSTLATLLLHLVVRDRRRGELLALLFIIVVPAIALLPGILLNSSDDAEAKPQRHSTPMPAWVSRGADVAQAVVPSELFARATRSSAQHERQRRDPAAPRALRLGDVPPHGRPRDLHPAARFTLDRDTTTNERPGGVDHRARAVPVAGQRRRGASARPAGPAHAARPIDRALAVGGLRVLCDRHLPARTDGARIRQPLQRAEPRHLRGRGLPARDPAVCAQPVRHRWLWVDAGVALPAQHATAAGRQGGGQRAHRRRYRAGGRARRLRPLSRRLALAVAEPAAGTRGHLRDRRTGSGRHSRRSSLAPSTSTASAGAATRTVSPVSWECSSLRPRACRQSSSRSSRRASFTGRS